MLNTTNEVLPVFIDVCTPGNVSETHKNDMMAYQNLRDGQVCDIGGLDCVSYLVVDDLQQADQAVEGWIEWELSHCDGRNSLLWR